MSAFKSHFVFSKNQRNGIFLLLALIVIVQCAYFYIDFSSDDIEVNSKELVEFQHEIDSLKLVEIEKSKPKIFPFNRLLAFRKQDKWINSVQQFQDVTQVSDSLLSEISPYFKFPDWVTNPKSKSNWKDYNNSNQYQTKTFEQKADLNTATALQLQKVNGVGVKLSDRIVKFRNKFVGGFIADVQLQDVYGLSPEVIERITNEFTVKTPRKVQKINLNTATRDQLVTIQHIDYEIAHHIIEQRTLRDGFKSLDDLTKVKNFPIQKIEIIKLYLTLN